MRVRERLVQPELLVRTFDLHHVSLHAVNAGNHAKRRDNQDERSENEDDHAHRADVRKDCRSGQRRRGQA